MNIRIIVSDSVPPDRILLVNQRGIENALTGKPPEPRDAAIVKVTPPKDG